VLDFSYKKYVTIYETKNKKIFKYLINQTHLQIVI
jgi:hypothetical protein